jgi:hypothetical protein
MVEMGSNYLDDGTLTSLARASKPLYQSIKSLPKPRDHAGLLCEVGDPETSVARAFYKTYVKQQRDQGQNLCARFLVAMRRHEV